MANRSYLIANRKNSVDYKCDSKDDIIAACNYSMPMFWFSMFSLEDIKSVNIEFDNGKIIPCPSLIVEKEKGLSRAVKRKSAIFRVIPNEYKKLFDQWLKYIGDFDTESIQVNLVEIMMMSELEEFKNNLNIALTEIDTNINKGLKMILDEFVGIKTKQGFFSSKIISPTTVSETNILLCGYGWSKPVPWVVR